MDFKCNLLRIIPASDYITECWEYYTKNTKFLQQYEIWFCYIREFAGNWYIVTEIIWKKNKLHFKTIGNIFNEWSLLETLGILVNNLVTIVEYYFYSQVQRK